MNTPLNQQPATKADTQEILSVIQDLITRIDERFDSLESRMDAAEQRWISDREDTLKLKKWGLKISKKVGVQFDAL